MDRLNSLPPRSQFRRPWSPEPFKPYPSPSHDTGSDLWPSQQTYQQQQQRREASDFSVEALDLAHYAMTLDSLTTERLTKSRYPPFRGQDLYPPSPPSLHPLAGPTSLQAPSPVSGRPIHSIPPSSRSPIYRPFSLPPPAPSRTQLTDNPSSLGHSHNYPYLVSPPSIHSQPTSGARSEIDITQFPPWSRSWYSSKQQKKVPHNTRSGNHDPTATKPSLFDPDYTNKHSGSHPHSHHPPGAYPMSNESSRDLVPWGSEHSSYPPIGAEVKEERMKMLQREFGVKSNSKGDGTSDGEQEDSRIVGSVDGNGKLVTQGPKKRVAFRMLEGLFALGSATTSIYAALVVKPKSVPPPSGKLPAYILYILSVITFLAIVYIFVFRPCCSSRRSPAQPGFGGMPGLPGMMVLQQGLGGGKDKKWKGGKKLIQRPGGDVHVNLIVDPGMLQGQQDDRYTEEYDEYDEHSSMPGSYGHVPSSASKRRARPRRSIFVGLAMEEQWRTARARLKKVMMFDIMSTVLWGAEFMLILVGKRCPSGEFEGWCNAYNVASACACLLCIAFGISVFFDVKDLHASKVSPRTRP